MPRAAKMSPMSKQKVYFPNLNGLRFLAAALVLVYHIEQMKWISHLGNAWETWPAIPLVGKLGVILFFVLSGFLITYLLLAEETRMGKINIRDFYMRRVLRIWPLYFLILFVGLAVMPNLGLLPFPTLESDLVQERLPLILLLYVFFLGNLVIPVMGIVPYVSHLWSIGTEEQFYLLWPVLVSRVKEHKMRLMFGVIGLYFAVKAVLFSPLAVYLPKLNTLRGFWEAFPISCMAIGGVYAVLLFRKSPKLAWVMRRDVFWVSTVLVSGMIAAGVVVPFVHYEFYAVFFGIIILNLSGNPALGTPLENPLMNYLGKISYGLYMYHPLAIMVVLTVLVRLGIQSDLILYGGSLLLTIVIAGLSYRYFEAYFLRFKARFAHILSGSSRAHEEGLPSVVPGATPVSGMASAKSPRRAEEPVGP